MGRTNKILIECSAPMPVQADGEVLSTDARLIQAEMIPNALEVLI
jgi:diacylglycerol kinase family enzyme